MATKAEQFRYDQERSGPKKKKKVKRAPKPMEKNTGSTADRNRTKAGEKNGTVKLESSESGRPSRKSSRRSKNRQRAASQLERSARDRARTPKERSTRAAAKKR
jgi:hypothetical protein